MTKRELFSVAYRTIREAEGSILPSKVREQVQFLTGCPVIPAMLASIDADRAFRARGAKPFDEKAWRVRRAASLRNARVFARMVAHSESK